MLLHTFAESCMQVLNHEQTERELSSTAIINKKKKSHQKM